MNRRELIKAGLACAIAPIIPLDAVKRITIKKKVGVEYTEIGTVFSEFTGSPPKQFLHKHKKAHKIGWDNIINKAVYEPIEANNFFKKA